MFFSGSEQNVEATELQPGVPDQAAEENAEEAMGEQTRGVGLPPVSSFAGSVSDGAGDYFYSASAAFVSATGGPAQVPYENHTPNQILKMAGKDFVGEVAFSHFATDTKGSDLQVALLGTCYFLPLLGMCLGVSPNTLSRAKSEPEVAKSCMDLVNGGFGLVLAGKLFKKPLGGCY